MILTRQKEHEKKKRAFRGIADLFSADGAHTKIGKMVSDFGST